MFPGFISCEVDGARISIVPEVHNVQWCVSRTSFEKQNDAYINLANKPYFSYLLDGKRFSFKNILKFLTLRWLFILPAVEAALLLKISRSF
jgi:hypothetical protein